MFTGKLLSLTLHRALGFTQYGTERAAERC